LNQLSEKQQEMIGFLSSKDAKDRLKKLAQKHLTAERMLTLAIECIHKTPKLAECEQLSVLGAFLTWTAI